MTPEEALEAMDLLRELVEPFGDEPCRLDHSGFCQAHYFYVPCVVARAKEFIER